MHGDVGSKKIGNVAIEAKSNNARIGFSNVVLSHSRIGNTTCEGQEWITCELKRNSDHEAEEAR